jgi:purine nucleosidase
MTRSAHNFVDVETRGEYTRGYTLVDVLGKLGRTPNTRVCLEADGARFRQLLMHVLAGG